MESIFGSTKNKRRSVGLKLSVIARQLRLNFDQSTKLRGLTRAKWTLIAAVSQNPGGTQRMIAQVLEVSEITAGAQPVLDKLDEVAKSHEAEIFAGFSNADLDKLDELLEAIARNLSAARSVRAAGK
jgi:MarR family transcriptional regulator for hemolysin